MMVLELEYGSAATEPLLLNHGTRLRAFPLLCIPYLKHKVTHRLWRRKAVATEKNSVNIM